MSKAAWQTIFITGLGVVIIFAAGIGWILYKTSTVRTGAFVSASEKSDQLPAGSQSAPADAPYSSLPVATSGTTTVGSTTPADQVSELEAVGQAIDQYKSELQKYPDSLEELETENPYVPIPPSFTYGSDGPLNDLYSLCVLAENSLVYKCISSELGSDDPFTFPAASAETYDFSIWQDLDWTPAASGENDVYMAYPPDWTYSTSTYHGDINGQDAKGNTVIIGRFNIFNWQMQPSQTFSEFEQQHVAQSTVQVSSSTLTTINGFPAYVLVGTEPEGGQTYDFLELLVQQHTDVFELNIFVDQTISDYFDTAILDMWSSIKIVPAK
jgi:hypothetical protein